MMKKYTDEQQKIIDHFGDNMLVSASAGSGKTGVLIAKISKILLDGMAKVKDLLIVTFTNAACDEIKQRLQRELSSSNNQAMRDQIDDLCVSDILTFDSFCKKVVEEFGYEIGVSSGFGIADKSLSNFLKNKALDNIIARHNQNANQTFMSVMNILFKSRSDKEFRSVISDIQNYISNHQDFDYYVNMLNKVYCDDLKNSPSIEYIENQFEFYKQNYAQNLNQLLLESQMLKEDKLASKLQDAISILSGFNKDYFQNMKYYFESYSAVSIRKDGKDTEALSQLKQTYQLQKSLFEKSLKRVFPEDLKNIAKDDILRFLQEDKTMLKNILILAKEFDAEYQLLKKNYQVLDFVDLEKFALKILQSKNIAKALQNKYKFVFIDEYQDTSKLQNDIIDLVTTGDNLMMVGDVKQSIYRYRNAEPQIFLNKYNMFKFDGINSVFELNKNFRSEKKILQFANLIFDAIMQKHIDGIDYKGTSTLSYGDIMPSCQSQNSVDVVLIDTHKIKDEDSAEQPEFSYYSVKDAPLTFDNEKGIEKESMMAAEKIVDYVKNKKYWNPNTKQFQDITYGDITILTRDQRGVILKVRKVLNDCGIPVKCNFEDNILNNFSIKLLLSILHLVENAQDDNSLLTVLTSIVGKLSFNEISKIRQFDRKSVFFHQAVQNYISNNDDKITQKIKTVFDKITNYKILSNSLNVCELLSHIVKTEELDKYFWLNGYGSQFDESFRLLMTSYQSIKDYSLCEFISYIDNFEDDTVTNQIADSENAVTISTIHSSKGLEYPVVIMLQCGKEFKNRPTTVYCDNDFGLAKQSIDLENRTKFDNPITLSFKHKMLEEEIKDEKRLLYVALTRPKNYLTIIGSLDVQNIAPIKTEFDLKSANSYLSWICGVLNENEISKLSETGKISKSVDDLVVNYEKVLLNNIILKRIEKSEEKESSIGASADFVDIITKKFSHSTLAQKNTVTQIMQEDDHYNISTFSAFENDEKGEDDFLQIGTVYHKIMENLNFSTDKNDIKLQIQNMIKKNVLSEAELSLVDQDKIFSASSTISTIITAGDVVLREQQFLSYMPANILLNSPENVKILIQGVADLIVIKPTEILLVDYKTSRLKDQKDFAKKYSKQLDIYAKSIENFYRKPVSKRYVYSFYLNKLLSI